MQTLKSSAIIRKTKEDYNRIARHFSATRYAIWPEMKLLDKYCRKGQNALDWGSGTGRLVPLILGKGVNYFGLDQSAELLKIARARYAKEIKDGRVKFFNTAGRDKNFGSGFFDLAFLVASFHHLPDENSRLRLLKKIYHEMKSSGKMLITVWNVDGGWEGGRYKQKIGTGDYLIPWKNSAGKIICQRYLHAFTASELRNILKQAGFKIKKIGYYAGGWTDKKRGNNLVAIGGK